MAERTIPEPVPEDFNIAFSAMIVTAESVGLDNVMTNEPLLATFRQVAEVHAQMASEIRWLYTMLHPGGEGLRATWQRAEDRMDEQHMEDMQRALDADWDALDKAALNQHTITGKLFR